MCCVIKRCMHRKLNNNNNNNNDNNLANMQLDHLLARSGLTRPEVPLMVSPDFFCLLVCRFLVFSVLYSIDMFQPVASVFLYFIKKTGVIFIYCIFSFFCSLFCSPHLCNFFIFLKYILMLNSRMFLSGFNRITVHSLTVSNLKKNIFFAGLRSYMWLKKFNICLNACIKLHCNFIYAYELRQWTTLLLIIILIR